MTFLVVSGLMANLLKPPFSLCPTTAHTTTFYYRPDDAGETALFSSNREGATYVDELLKSCCYDIYKANIKIFKSTSTHSPLIKHR